MAWWNEILQLLRDEADYHAGQLGATEQLREAQQVLERTTRELDDASARAESARRRMRNAQQELEVLAAKPQRHASYAERLSELARALTHETELVATFDAHIARLAQLRDRMDAQLRQLQRDLSMVESAAGAAATSRAAEAHEQTHEPTRHSDKPAGFRQQQPKAVMDALDALPRKRRKRSDEG